ncbi:hypothetical protein Dehly_1007 [Dehalogenimonas lykanthroporepellens BL-DC-9]|jgi:hypothetical protein|nr:hypothetical protein Dehly_1007 [Dehalogenimonas lykanthroporepellens BL-DC-9]
MISGGLPRMVKPSKFNKLSLRVSTENMSGYFYNSGYFSIIPASDNVLAVTKISSSEEIRAVSEIAHHQVFTITGHI